MGTVNCLVTNSLQNIFCCVQHKEEIHTGLEQLKGESFFQVNYPFNKLE